MFTITLDSEQAMILLVALHASNTIMSARLERVDPGEVISNSVKLQSHKIANIQAQLDGGEIAKWSEISPASRVAFLAAAHMICDAKHDHEAEAAYERMKQFVLTERNGVTPQLNLKRAN